MTSTEKAYRKWLGKMLGKCLSDCVVGGAGWRDSEVEAFRTDRTKNHVLRDRHLAFPEKLYRNRFTLRSAVLRDHMDRTLDVELINQAAAETILAYFVAPETFDFPFPCHREDERVYFLLDMKWVERNRLVRILDLLAAELQTTVLGRPTLWTDDDRIMCRGDRVLLPRTQPAIEAFPARSIVEYYRAKHYTQPVSRPQSVKIVKFCVPVNIEAILSKLPQELRRYEDNARLIFSTIRQRWVTWQADEEGYVRLNVDVLRKFIHPTKEKLLRHWLCDNGYLLVKAQEADGRQLGTTFNGSLKYAVAPEYDMADWHMVECGNDKINVKLKDYKRRGLSEPVHRYIEDCLDGVTIDMVEAEAVCRSIDEELLRNNAELRFSANMTTAEMISQKQFNVSRCDKGRMHSVITGADRRLRDILSFDGEPIVWSDIRNSQPLLFGIILLNKALFDEQIVDFTSFRTLMAKEMERIPQGCVCPPSPLLVVPHAPITPYTSSNLSKSPVGTTDYRDNLHPDEQAYIQDCERGIFYEQIMEASELPVTRDQLKEIVFRDIFYSSSDYHSLARKAFTSLYPSVMDTILNIRRRSRGQKGMVPCMMQYVESCLIINIIGKRLMKEGIRFLTIHDAIGCRSRHKDRVIEVIREEYHRVGLQPTLKVEGAGQR